MVIDGIEYSFQQMNFIATKNQALKLAGLLKGCFVSDGDKTGFDVGQALANLGSEETRVVEEFIVKTISAKDETGKAVLLNQSDVFNEHFNKHRDHYFQVIFEGVKFHFLGFLPNGIASKVNTLNLDSLMESQM